jgi:hypothetical protein
LLGWFCNSDFNRRAPVGGFCNLQGSLEKSGTGCFTAFVVVCGAASFIGSFPRIADVARLFGF